MTIYSNIPVSTSTNQVMNAYDTYVTKPISIDVGTYDAVVGFFESKGFNADAAKSTAYIIIKQATVENYNPFDILNTMKGMSSLEISSLITEILNYNRFKTSFLGSVATLTPKEEIQRNIIN